MQTQEGGNVGVCAVHGNFDDAQTGVKTPLLRRASAGRSGKAGLLPVLCQLHQLGPDPAAAGLLHLRLLRPAERWARSKWARRSTTACPPATSAISWPAGTPSQMGLPVGKLICASNSNNVLTDFLATGTYDRNRPFYTTMSPSMDILISSNLERLLFALSGQDEQAGGRLHAAAEQARQLYGLRRDQGKAQVRFLRRLLQRGGDAARSSPRFWKKYNYLIDPHTAVAYDVMEKYRAGDRRHQQDRRSSPPPAPSSSATACCTAWAWPRSRTASTPWTSSPQTTNRPAPVPLACSAEQGRALHRERGQGEDGGRGAGDAEAKEAPVALYTLGDTAPVLCR